MERAVALMFCCYLCDCIDSSFECLLSVASFFRAVQVRPYGRN